MCEIDAGSYAEAETGPGPDTGPAPASGTFQYNGHPAYA
jgi:hypothetical protein